MAPARVRVCTMCLQSIPEGKIPYYKDERFFCCFQCVARYVYEKAELQDKKDSGVRLIDCNKIKQCQ